MTDEDFYIKSLGLEIAALRSILSEFEGDKLEYVQMVLANDLSRLRENPKRPSW